MQVYIGICFRFYSCNVSAAAFIVTLLYNVCSHWNVTCYNYGLVIFYEIYARLLWTESQSRALAIMIPVAVITITFFMISFGRYWNLYYLYSWNSYLIFLTVKVPTYVCLLSLTNYACYHFQSIYISAMVPIIKTVA